MIKKPTIQERITTATKLHKKIGGLVHVNYKKELVRVVCDGVNGHIEITRNNNLDTTYFYNRALKIELSKTYHLLDGSVHAVTGRFGKIMHNK